MELKLEENGAKEVWNGMKRITGYKFSSNTATCGSVDRANTLNEFFNRFGAIFMKFLYNS